MGGGGGDHHGGAHEAPDWKSFKAEGISGLDHLQKRLGALGLRDPWIRLEARRYLVATGGNKDWIYRAIRAPFWGLPFAVGALALTILYDKVVNRGKDKHGHGHH